jgi:hypothetical protein
MTEQNIITELANFTEAGEHTKFQLLQNWQEYRFAVKTRTTLKLLTKSLRFAMTKQLKQYCKQVTAGTANFNSLLAYEYLAKILDFYLEELGIVTNMIDEYEVYLSEGNYLESFFGEQRPVNKLWDHRG